ncbi:MAG: permease [Candidatus Nanogingivalaceae bacterium]|nr:permease [Candidatus Nanogingivalaceae bacterium]
MAKNQSKKPSTSELVSIIQIFAGWIIAIILIVVIYLYSPQLGLWLISDKSSVWFSETATMLQDFLTITLSIIIEALPFLILGIIISALIRRFLSTAKLAKILPNNPFLRRFILSISGLALPVCECGNMPVARSLLAQGLKPADVVSFLFAAPILNPITIIATITAFSFQPYMIWWRIIFALIIVQLTAFAVSFLKEDKVIRPAFKEYCRAYRHNHGFKEILSSSRNEFWQLFTMLSIGAVIAAATQVFIPRTIINTISNDIILSVVAMIVLSFVVSICSSIDAFFALAYARSFTTGSILSFLLAGPMIDIKLIMLMRTTFSWRFIAAVMLIIFTLSFTAGIGANLLYAI